MEERSAAPTNAMDGIGRESLGDERVYRCTNPRLAWNTESSRLAVPLLHIQDPTDPESPLLRDVLVSAAIGASSGGGTFAFASRGGVSLLFNDQDMQAFLVAGQFRLVVGVDEITDEAALSCLSDIVQGYPNLRVDVFYNAQRPALLFHPKFAWFRRPGGHLTCIVGSGNLTEKGLTKNWEAFTVSPTANAAANEIEATWNAWLASHAGDLRALDDADVRVRANENTRRNRQRRLRPLGADDPSPLPIEMPVLLAEIPGPQRWTQANVDKTTFLGYFDASLDQETNRRNKLNLWPIDAGGVRGNVEVRPPIVVASRNFRVELGAASGIQYPPGDARPIAVFVKLGTRNFNYRLLMPGGVGYEAVRARLHELVPVVQAARMRRVRISVRQLAELLPNFPSSGGTGE